MAFCLPGFFSKWILTVAFHIHFPKAHSETQTLKTEESMKASGISKICECVCVCVCWGGRCKVPHGGCVQDVTDWKEGQLVGHLRAIERIGHLPFMPHGIPTICNCHV
jgi:hypothetical protein